MVRITLSRMDEIRTFFINGAINVVGSGSLIFGMVTKIGDRLNIITDILGPMGDIVTFISLCLGAVWAFYRVKLIRAKFHDEITKDKDDKGSN